MFSTPMLIVTLLFESATIVPSSPLPSCGAWELTLREVQRVMCVCHTISGLEVCAGKVDIDSRFLELYTNRRDGQRPWAYIELQMHMQ